MYSWSAPVQSGFLPMCEFCLVQVPTKFDTWSAYDKTLSSQLYTQFWICLWGNKTSRSRNVLPSGVDLFSCSLYNLDWELVQWASGWDWAWNAVFSSPKPCPDCDPLQPVLTRLIQTAFYINPDLFRPQKHVNLVWTAWGPTIIYGCEHLRTPPEVFGKKLVQVSLAKYVGQVRTPEFNLGQ